jgi:hypothetical protein
MIIDCCKMTPVQSKYWLFSMIISCHFSHMRVTVLSPSNNTDTLSDHIF